MCILIISYLQIAASSNQFSCPLGVGSIWNDKWYLFSPLNSFFSPTSFFLSLSPIIWTRNETVWWLFYVLSKPWVEIYSEWVFLFYPYCLFVYLTLTNFVEPIESFFFLILLSYYSPLSPNSHSILKRFMLLQA